MDTVPANEMTLTAQDEAEILNSLTDLTLMLGNTPGYGQTNTPTISSISSMFYNMRWYLVSNYRQVLAQLYAEHGIIQTLVDQPVDDGFRPGFEIRTSNLSPEEIQKLELYIERNEVIANIKQAVQWARLFGGGGILIITDQNPASPLNIERLNKNSRIEFRACDLWELYSQSITTQPGMGVDEKLGASTGDFYYYYGHKVHKSRVYPIKGKEPPSFIKPRLRGWGLSVVEPLVRSLNQFLKNQDVVFELLDEAKIDVYKVKGYNSALMSKSGTTKITTQVQLTNQLKNYNNAITMDADDEYQQKQVTFSGLAEMLNQIRQGIACDVKMPITKLFGVSAAGFNSGEDDIENYNAMIDSEIRAKTKFIVLDILQICCLKLFGQTIDDLDINWNPLRVLNAKEEEEVKTSKFNRVMASFSASLIPPQEAKQSINKDSLLPIEIKEDDELFDSGSVDIDPNRFTVASGAASGNGGKRTPEQA